MKFLRNIRHRCLLLLILFPVLATAQEESNSLDALIIEWEALSAREDLLLHDRLVSQTNIIHAASEWFALTSEPVWTWVQATLDLWETSSEIELARESYLSILMEIGAIQQESGQPFPGEDLLRGYIQRALSLNLSSVEEGTLLLYLAESWIRTADGGPERFRRAESILQQAADVLGRELPMDAVHAYLGELLLRDGDTQDSEISSFRDPRITQAVFHYRAIQSLSGARQVYLEQAEDKLSILLEPELDYRIPNRYLPKNDIRFSVQSRNIPFLDVDLVPLTYYGALPMTRLEMLQEIWSDSEVSPEKIILSKRFPVRTRTPFDWAETEIRLGEDFPGGWYGLRVRGEGVEVKELLLVTTLEIAAIPRPSGDLAIWISDAESGLSLPGTKVYILDDSGAVITQEETGENGFFILESEAVDGWYELQVMSGQNPGVLLRESIPGEVGQVPWVVTNSLEVEPGQSIQFSVFGVDAEDFIDQATEFSVLFPDGSVVNPEIQSQHSTWMSGQVQIPGSTSVAGPLYLELYGNRMLLSHIAIAHSLPIGIAFTGDQLSLNSNLFLDSSSLGIQLDASTPVWDSLPEYIRLRVLRMDRKKQVSGSSTERPNTEHILLENIFSIDDAQRQGSLVILPDLPTGESFLPIKVEVVSLDGDELLGMGHAVLMNYRTLVHLRTDEQIIQTGEVVRVRLDYEDTGDATWRPRSGDLVIYRETWESRYIHRKKGNLISESEYIILPDRSLLGAAKTDFRIVEQGYVREEIQRVPIKANSKSVSIPINFERPGYYHIDFESAESDIKATYEDGALEVWVLPDSGDMHAFRSVEPRVIIESTADNSYECLLILDRPETSVLMDFEHEDGSTLTRIVRPETSAVVYNYFPETGSPLLTCRFFIVGDRKTEFLWRKLREKSQLTWTIGADRFLGINPGAAFTWPVSFSGGLGETPIFWTFFPDTVSPLIDRRSEWQRTFRSEELRRRPVPMMFLEESFPLFHPLNTRGPAGVSGAVQEGNAPLSSIDILSLYPEIISPGNKSPSADTLSLFMPPETGNTVQLRGSFPDSAGRWNLILFAESVHGDLSTEQWLVSTELPVRSHLGGPPVLRVGDLAELRLQLENTTHDPVGLSMEIQSEGVSSAAETRIQEVILSAGEVEELYYPVSENTAGTGKFTVRATGSGTTVESIHSYEILDDIPATAWDFRIVPPQGGIWKDSLEFPGWKEGIFMTASGLGSLLPELWPHIRNAQPDTESLVVVLGDWALFRTLKFHGLPDGEFVEDVSDKLLSLLAGSQAGNGGWSWSANGPSDPWLSALVLWALDSFRDSTSDSFSGILVSARRYLEEILIDNNLETGVRLFALRALAAGANSSENVRPTRIQARSFLEFLYQRDSLSTTELAMLLEIARAYEFREEILLLVNELRQLTSMENTSTSASFFSESLVFLALNEESARTETHLEGLDGTLKALSSAGPSRGWEHVAGILNLMSSFYWKGEFNIDGQIRMTLNDSEPVDFMLNPDLSHTGLYPLSMDEKMLEQLSIEVDTAFALSPVILAFVGSLSSNPDIPDYPDYAVELFREFDETTLLTGTHKRLVEIVGNPVDTRRGDVLRMQLTLTVEESEPYAELCLPVPAGLSTEDQSIEHAWQSLSPELPPGDSSPISFHSMESDDSCRIFRIEPFQAGRHIIEIPFKVRWTGNYSWPANILIYPQSGKSFQIENGGPLEIVHPMD